MYVAAQEQLADGVVQILLFFESLSSDTVRMLCSPDYLLTCLPYYVDSTINDLLGCCNPAGFPQSDLGLQRG